jgi:hypothetical protein
MGDMVFSQYTYKPIPIAGQIRLVCVVRLVSLLTDKFCLFHCPFTNEKLPFSVDFFILNFIIPQCFNSMSISNLRNSEQLRTWNFVEFHGSTGKNNLEKKFRIPGVHSCALQTENGVFRWFDANGNGKWKFVVSWSANDKR